MKQLIGVCTNLINIFLFTKDGRCTVEAIRDYFGFCFSILMLVVFCFKVIFCIRNGIQN